MLRRFSKFTKKDGVKKHTEVNGTNGINGTNGDSGVNGTNGEHAEKSVLDKRASSAPKKSKNENTDHSGSRSEVESSFEQYAQIIQASQRPLPTQSNDEASLDHVEPSSLLSDLKASM